MRDALTAAAGRLETLPASPPATLAGWQRTYTFAPQSTVFAGHFPGRPMVPAVVQCLMAQTTAEEATGKCLLLKSIVQAKFSRVLGPHEAITLSLTPAKAAEQWDAVLTVGPEVAAKIRLRLQEKKPEHS